MLRNVYYSGISHRVDSMALTFCRWRALLMVLMFVNIDKFKFSVGGNELIIPNWVDNWATVERSFTKRIIMMKRKQTLSLFKKHCLQTPSQWMITSVGLLNETINNNFHSKPSSIAEADGWFGSILDIRLGWISKTNNKRNCKQIDLNK